MPYDSPKAYEKGSYEGERLIRDDELGDLFNEVRSRIGERGHLLVLLDACHSGTGTREISSARGTPVNRIFPLLLGGFCIGGITIAL